MTFMKVWLQAAGKCNHESESAFAFPKYNFYVQLMVPKFTTLRPEIRAFLVKKN